MDIVKEYLDYCESLDINLDVLDIIEDGDDFVILINNEFITPYQFTNLKYSCGSNLKDYIVEINVLDFESIRTYYNKTYDNKDLINDLTFIINLKSSKV